MKSTLQKFSSSKWQSLITLAALFVLLTASSAQAEPPHAQLRPFAPGGIAIDWEHPNDGAESITLEREDPAFTWVFTALVNSFNDLGLQPSRVYRYRVCARYGATLDCTPWLAAQTLATSPPSSPPGAPSFTSSSATTNSITVNWTSSASYSFHQVRWAENGSPDGQDRVDGRSFTVDGLRPGSYHFIVQGCNRTLLGSSCSRFSAPIEVATRVPAPPSAPPPAPSLHFIGSNDFNDDGHGDILWYNASTGESQIWFMNGSSRIGRATILDGARPALIGPPWSIVGSRDFNGDGKTDLLWHNSSTGETQIWYMNGYQVSGRATVLGENGSPAFVGLPWSVVGTNDFNEILWHNASTGETQIWHMDGYKVSGRATVLGEDGSPAFVGLPWSIVGTNEFNQDGKADILWHNAATGETQIWHMDGYKVSGRATVLGENGSPIFVGLPWSIVGTNDFNQDGKADILWHNAATGETQMWLMNGRSVVRRVTVDAAHDGGGAMVGPPWSIMNH